MTVAGLTAGLGSFDAGIRSVVMGASGGIGSALVGQLHASPHVDVVAACSRQKNATLGPKALPLSFNLDDEETIARAAEDIANRVEKLDLVIVATGVLHQDDVLLPEKTWRSLDAAAMERVFRINTIGPALIAKHFLPLLARDRKSVFAALSARVGSIGDNQLGGWHAYRASKAALNMLIRNFAIELERRHPQGIVVGLHPGTTDTALSKPFQSHVPKGKLFSTAFVADRLLRVIDGLTPEDSGLVYDWDGKVIPF
ncbi:MAG: SDR family NAD(P)-dependent oxidoreductase [Pseudomonadota bacterium]